MTLNDIQNLPAIPEKFGPARQVAYIVDNIDGAIAHWKSLGVPAFLVSRNATPLQNMYYRGQKSEAAPVNIAFGYFGDMQIELIEPLHDFPSIYTEARERNITGVHHYAVCVENFPECYNHALANGFEAIVDSGVDGLARMSYVENKSENLILELIEWNDLTRPYMDSIQALCEVASKTGQDADLDISSLTPKGALTKALGGFLVRKITGRVQKTMLGA